MAPYMGSTCMAMAPNNIQKSGFMLFQSQHECSGEKSEFFSTASESKWSQNGAPQEHKFSHNKYIIFQVFFIIIKLNI